MDKVLAILGTLAVAVVVTSATLPGRETPALVGALGTAYQSAALASEGVH
jgi:hypothetical protein